MDTDQTRIRSYRRRSLLILLSVFHPCPAVAKWSLSSWRQSMNANWFRWLVRIALVVIAVALILFSRLAGYPSSSFPSWQAGDLVIAGLILVGGVGVVLLLWQ